MTTMHAQCEVTAELSTISTSGNKYFFLNETFEGLVWKAAFLCKPDRDTPKTFEPGSVLIKLKYEHCKTKRLGAQTVYIQVFIENLRENRHGIRSEITQIAISPKATTIGFESKPIFIKLCQLSDREVFDPQQTFANKGGHLKITVIISTTASFFESDRFKSFRTLIEQGNYYTKIEPDIISRMQVGFDLMKVGEFGKAKRRFEIIINLFYKQWNVERGQMIQMYADNLAYILFDISILDLKSRHDVSLKNRDHVDLGILSTIFLENRVYTFALTIAIEARELAFELQDTKIVQEMDRIISECMIWVGSEYNKLMDKPAVQTEFGLSYLLFDPLKGQLNETKFKEALVSKYTQFSNGSGLLSVRAPENHSTKSWMHIAKSYLKLHRYSEAIEIFNRILVEIKGCIESEGLIIRILESRSKCYGENGQVELNLKDLHSLSVIRKVDELDSYTALANYYIDNKKYSECLLYSEERRSENSDVMLAIGEKIEQCNYLINQTKSKMEKVQTLSVSYVASANSNCLSSHDEQKPAPLGFWEEGDDEEKTVVQVREESHTFEESLPKYGSSESLDKKMSKFAYDVDAGADCFHSSSAVTSPKKRNGDSCWVLKESIVSYDQTLFTLQVDSSIAANDAHKQDEIDESFKLISNSNTYSQDLSNLSVNSKNFDESSIEFSVPSTSSSPNNSLDHDNPLSGNSGHYCNQSQSYPLHNPRGSLESPPPIYYYEMVDPSLDVMYFCPATGKHLGRFVPMVGQFEQGYQLYELCFFEDGGRDIEYEGIQCDDGSFLTDGDVSIGSEIDEGRIMNEVNYCNENLIRCHMGNEFEYGLPGASQNQFTNNNNPHYQPYYQQPIQPSYGGSGYGGNLSRESSYPGHYQSYPPMHNSCPTYYPPIYPREASYPMPHQPHLAPSYHAMH